MVSASFCLNFPLARFAKAAMAVCPSGICNASYDMFGTRTGRTFLIETLP